MIDHLTDTNVGNIEYISKQDASDWLKQYGQDVLHGKYKFSLMYIWKNLMDLPPADVAPVVRCKKCKFRENDDFCTGRGFPYQLVPDDGFCDKGERKE